MSEYKTCSVCLLGRDCLDHPESVQPDIEALTDEELIALLESQTVVTDGKWHRGIRLLRAQQSAITSLTEQAEALADFIEIAAWFGLHREEDEDCPVCWAKELLAALGEKEGK